MPRIFTVAEITQAVANTLESEFPFVWVKGQVTNIGRPGSGHLYFSLKDQDASLAVVWFKSSQQSAAGSGAERINPLTGEVMEGVGFTLQEGMEILVAGRLNVYAPRGTYQLVAELVQEQGVGALHLAFEALKKKLAGLGYFDAARKREIPKNPRRVAVVTSPKGAAVRDFIKIAKARGLGGKIRIYPALVQGDSAPASITAAMDQALADDWADVLVLIRGGGSIEDLWAFNTEPVAQAIFSSPLPVLCGVGHEVDTTIADLVADTRAATPTHAAQLLWSERETLMQGLDEAELRLIKGAIRFVDAFDVRLAQQEKGLGWFNPKVRVDRLMERLETVSGALAQAGGHWIDTKMRALDQKTERLETLYGPEFWKLHDARINALMERLREKTGQLLEYTKTNLDVLDARLTPLDPYAPLKRGYSMVKKEDGSFVCDARDIQPGELMHILLAKGRIAARAEEITEER